jgi:hypothetical protein
MTAAPQGDLPSRSLTITSFTLIAAFVLGAVGFVSGFRGPIYIGQMVGYDWSLGPLTGFIEGPLCFCLGALLGFVCALKKLRPGSFALVLLLSALCVAVGTLYSFIPDSQYKGTIIDARIQGCALVSDNWDKAMSAMESQVVEQMKWGAVRHPDWRHVIENKKKTEKGVVLSMLVIQERKLYERKEPWNLGVIEGSRWKSVNGTRKYFARFAGDSCGSYTSHASRKMYWPAPEDFPGFPPDNVPAFLDLKVLGDVPEAYMKFIGSTPPTD